MTTAHPTSGAQGTEGEENPLDLGFGWMWAVMSNCQSILYHDELVRGDVGPVPTEIIHFFCEKRSVHTTECIVTAVYIRLPFLNTPYSACDDVG